MIITLIILLYNKYFANIMKFKVLSNEGKMFANYITYLLLKFITNLIRETEY